MRVTLGKDFDVREANDGEKIRIENVIRVFKGTINIYLVTADGETKEYKVSEYRFMHVYE